MSDAADILLQMLRHPHAWRRARAARSLGRTPDAPGVAAALAEALRDPHPTVREAAALSLAPCTDAAVLPGLCEALAESDPATARAAARALISHPGEAALRALLSALEQGTPQVRRDVAGALAAWATGDHAHLALRATPALRKLARLGASAPTDRRAFRVALAGIEGAAGTALPIPAHGNEPRGESLPIPTPGASGHATALPVPACAPKPVADDTG